MKVKSGSFVLDRQLVHVVCSSNTAHCLRTGSYCHALTLCCTWTVLECASGTPLHGGQKSISCYTERIHVTHWVDPRADVEAAEMIRSTVSTAHERRPIGRAANNWRISTVLFELQTWLVKASTCWVNMGVRVGRCGGRQWDRVERAGRSGEGQCHFVVTLHWAYVAGWAMWWVAGSCGDTVIVESWIVG